LLVASCGRLSFDATSDATTSDTGALDAFVETPALTNVSSSSTGTGPTFTTLPVTIPRTTADNLIVVAVALHGGEPITSVTDDAGNSYTQAGRSLAGSTASEIWYATNSAPAQMVTVQIGFSGHFDVWVAEFSGTSPAPPVVGMGCLQYPPDIALTAGATTVPNQLIVSVTMCAAPLYVDQVLPPFTGFPTSTGNGGGYYIAPTPGSYGTTFSISSGQGMTAMTCATTATWMPGP
jgi:hypothetical protein